jgi:hypothetical protein
MDTTTANQSNSSKPARALPTDIILSIIAFLSIILASLLNFYLGASGPGLTLWMYLVIGLVLLLVSQLLVFIIFKRATVRRVLILRSVLAPVILVAIIGNIFGFVGVLFFPILLVPTALVLLAIGICRTLFEKTKDNSWLLVRALFAVLLLGISVASLMMQFTSLAGIKEGWALFLGLRTSVTAKVKLDELQAAAVALMAYDNQRGEGERPLSLFSKQIADTAVVPEALGRIHPHIIDVSRSRGENPKAEYVRLIWGGGMMSYEVIVGPPSFVYGKKRGTQKWQDGIYGDLRQ